MIKFFRHIRQRMIKENRVSKYMLYAIGEIVLVVAGILIALWLNNLNHEKQKRREEIEILKELKKDFQADIIDFKINIECYEIIISSTDIILKSLESSVPYHDSLDSYFAQTMCWPISIIHRNAFDVLKSKGLDLISNDSLRTEILNFHGQVYVSVKSWEDDAKKDMFFDELIKRFDKVEPWNFDENGKFHIGEMKPNNYHALKTDTLYLSILRTMKTGAELNLNKCYFRIVEDVENLTVKIDAEISNLEEQ